MGVFDQMGEGDEGRVEGFAGGDSPILIDRQHSLKNVDEFPTIRLFAEQLGPLQVRRNVDLDGSTAILSQS